MAKYRNDIDEVFKVIHKWHEDYINFEDFVDLFFQEAGLTYEGMSRDIETGIANGYNLEFQKGLLKEGLKAIFETM